MRFALTLVVALLALLASCGGGEPACGDPEVSFAATTVRLRAWPGDAAPALSTPLTIESEDCGSFEVRSDAAWLSATREGDAVSLAGDPAAAGPGLHTSSVRLVDDAGATLATLPVTLSVMQVPAADAERHVLVIGIDGCRPDALRAAETPNIDALARMGRATFAASTQLQAPTKSGPGWASVLTGVDAAKHLVDTNDDLTDIDRAYPTFLQRAETAGLGVALSSQWAGIRTLVEPDIAARSGSGVAREVVAAARERFVAPDVDVAFVHLDDVDIQGHLTGFSPDNPAYVRSIATVDGHVGGVVDAILARPTYASERWMIILTTDHGGSGLDHGPLDAENRTIFLVVSDPAGETGELTGDALSHLDVAPTALAFVGVTIDPTWGLDGQAR